MFERIQGPFISFAFIMQLSIMVNFGEEYVFEHPRLGDEFSHVVNSLFVAFSTPFAEISLK